MDNQNTVKENLAEYLDWAAKQMKKLAEKTVDPTLKTKYEQLAGINMEYRDRCLSSQQKGADSKLTKEIKLLKGALYFQKAIFNEFASTAAISASPLIDEIMDRQKQICRELSDEIGKREAL